MDQRQQTPGKTRKGGYDPSKRFIVDQRSVRVGTRHQARGRRLKMNKPPEEIISALLETGFQALPIRIPHALAIQTLPPKHADPFDRILVAQAQCEDLTIVTADPAITACDVRTIDASD